ncbi:MAG: AraC family transcriptional regulator [Motiliproteus sp.]|nr:AraC family transcriptional regulator [Motiliproteus sp.]
MQIELPQHPISSDQALRNRPIPFTESKAKPLRSLNLSEGVRAVQYENGNEHVFYENTGQHTFSLYLQGGYQTQRSDIQSPHGAPGLFCLMPKDSYSAWTVGGDQSFVHLYFCDDYLKRLAMETFDLDPRLVELPLLSFSRDQHLDAIVRHALLSWDWHAPANHLALEQAINTLLVNLIKSVDIPRRAPQSSLQGGLSPQAQRHLRDYVEAHTHRQISLQELADLTGLSQYHFCRMFKISFSETPQQYVMRIRIEKVKTVLKNFQRKGQKANLSQLALSAGFSNQSHMGRVFKKLVGCSPGQYSRRI